MHTDTHKRDTYITNATHPHNTFRNALAERFACIQTCIVSYLHNQVVVILSIAVSLGVIVVIPTDIYNTVQASNEDVYGDAIRMAYYGKCGSSVWLLCL